MSKEIKAQQIIYKIINPLINLFVKVGVTPNMITTIGLLLNIVACVIFIIGAKFGERNDMTYVGWGGFTILIAGLFDMIDGRLARIGNMSSTFGALYDSVLDRYSEMIMFLGICYYLVAQSFFLSSLFAFIALIGSMMVSYTRARAEGLGINCSVGMMQRPARVVTIGAAAMFCGIFYYFFGNVGPIRLATSPLIVFETITIFTLPVTVVAVLSNITAIQRLNHCKVELEKKEK
ncbi:MAG: CDP-diacylglycerol--inositol 3-phosphatidyltransferase [Flavobacteriales bacterium CG18_big_fil_WC_8_21_14_2_50_32_9]|nr:MAG: CDP-diacylglycerol--inositol 3-phosphatidyltransferase [Flavobacteriales bacterium CG18_big_fil_WC_8_21_14_2_50_32_9]PJC61982.1 MAG: CDP-alcohol phosphatidyltransferase family protein [Flavobacteriales bacterium CG_4_9_14_0_2_um_filter_32_27]